MTPKIKVRPAAISAKTPPVRIPPMMARVSSVPNFHTSLWRDVHDLRLEERITRLPERSAYQLFFGYSSALVAGGTAVSTLDEFGWNGTRFAPCHWNT
jgi:hypothetical protein